ncbi:MAG TPA: histidine kinase [Anaerolineae bacterium]|nr:histidine kinase [Anaerolineae bacterium]HQH39091.1 histidine kinase [Anaerolineae bacterium]
MQNNRHPARIQVWHKLSLSHAVVTMVSVLLTEVMVLGLLALLRGEISWGIHITCVTLGAAIVGLLLGMMVSHPLARRLRHIHNICQAWLRGNLSLRILDSHRDDLGMLAEQLNALADNLEKDEEDLGALHERNARLSDQVRALAVVEERNRLARELHDSVKQHLFSLTMTASAIRTHFDALGQATDTTLPANIAQLADMAREIEKAAQNAQRETTRLIEDLRPGTLQEQGLATALNDYTLLFGAQEHLLIYLEVQGDDKRLPPTVTEALYRVAQEALHNVARHAKATRVDVHLRCSSDRAALTIKDNGVGFDTTQASHGLGLANMQERLMAIGGRLTLESQVGIGTTVLAEVELPYPLTPTAGTAGATGHRPDPTIENWAWLGAKLEIPVGQTWPWLPADLQYLRSPLLEPDTAPFHCRRVPSFLGLGRSYTVTGGDQNILIVRLHRGVAGFEWESDGASWALRPVRGLNGRMVLRRNRQPLAAIQYQGRQMNTWSEIIYDRRGYRLAYAKSETGCSFILTDENGQEWLCFKGNGAYQITLYRAMALPLLAMVTARIIDEIAVA